MDTEEEVKITTEVRTHRKGRPNKSIINERTESR